MDSITVGTVKQVLRYPVKSMAGESMAEAVLGAKGILGDRTWTIYNEERDEITNAKMFPKILMLKARYEEAPKKDFKTNVEITFPNGEIVSTTSPNIDAKLTEFLGQKVSLKPLQPAFVKEFYALTQKKTAAEMRHIFGLNPNDPSPDLSVYPLHTLYTLSKYATPPGTFFDSNSLHILTTSSLDFISDYHSKGNCQVERFRPNLLIETSSNKKEYLEQEWCGHQLAIGDTLINCQHPTPRCSMITAAQIGLERDRRLGTAVLKATGHKMGIYAEPKINGLIKQGEKVRLIKRKKYFFIQMLKGMKNKIVYKVVESSFKE